LSGERGTTGSLRRHQRSVPHPFAHAANQRDTNTDGWPRGIVNANYASSRTAPNEPAGRANQYATAGCHPDTDTHHSSDLCNVNFRPSYYCTNDCSIANLYPADACFTDGYTPTANPYPADARATHPCPANGPTTTDGPAASAAY
jgi:hypothetical protein